MASAARRSAVLVLATCAAFLLSVPAAAQYVVIHHLDVGEGNSPRSGLVQDAQENLYGAAVFGGAHGDGSVFKLEPDGDNFLVLHSFDGTDGQNPYGGVILGGGFLFGTTAEGGNN